MKKLFWGICIFLLSQQLYSQSVIGLVTDAGSGAPLPAASISLARSGSQLSDARGFFRFYPVKAGEHQLRVSHVGYQSVELSIKAGNDTVRIRMEKLQLFMQPVEVSALRAGDRAPFTKTNISAADLARENLGQDLPFLLSQTPSVVVHSDAGNGIGYTGIRIRGTDATRINVTLNGIPYNDAESQGTYFVDLPDFSSSVSSLQIQRGVGTSSNGAGAFGATINLSTNEVHPDAYGSINNSYGSFNSWKNTVKAGSGLIDGHFTLDARLSHISSDGYIDRAGSQLGSYYLSGAYLSGKTSIRLNIFSGKEKTYQAWYGVSQADLATHRTINYAGTEKPGTPYDNETDNYLQTHYQLFLNQQLSSHLTFNTAFFLSKGKGYYEEYKAAQAYADYGLPVFSVGQQTLTSTDLVRQLWLDNDFYGQIFSLQYKKNKDQLSFGGAWTRYDGLHYGTVIWARAGIPKDYRYYDHKAFKSDLNFYGKYQRQLGKGLDLFADLQFRRVLYNIDGFESNPAVNIHHVYPFFNPKLGFSYQKGNYQWYVSYSYGQKEPNRDDYEAGIYQQPVPEQLHDVEAGVEYKHHRAGWGATFYYMRYHNQLVLTGKINDVGAYTRTNIPDSYRMGIEMQGQWQMRNWLHLSGNLTLSSNKIAHFVEYYDDYDNGGQKSIDHGTTDIALSPAVTGAATVSILPFRNWELALISKYVSRQYLDNTSNPDRSLNPYFVEDARISWSLRHFVFRQSTVILQVNNIFNKLYEPNGYTYSYQYGGSLITENYYYPMAGTNFMLAWNIDL